MHLKKVVGVEYSEFTWHRIRSGCWLLWAR